MKDFLDTAIIKANSLLYDHDQLHVQAISNWLQTDKKSYIEKAQAIKRYLPAIFEQTKKNIGAQKLLSSVNAIVKLLELANLIEQVYIIINKSIVEEVSSKGKTANEIIATVSPILFDFLCKFTFVENKHEFDKEEFPSLMLRVLEILQNNTAKRQSTVIDTFRVLREEIVELQTAKQYLEESSKQVLALGEKNIEKLSENIRIKGWQAIYEKRLLEKIVETAAELKILLQSNLEVSNHTKQNLIESADRLVLAKGDGQLGFELQNQLQDHLQKSIDQELQQPVFQEKMITIFQTYQAAADAVVAPIVLIQNKTVELQDQKKKLEQDEEIKARQEKIRILKASNALINKKHVEMDGFLFDKIQAALIKSQQFTDLLRYTKPEKRELVVRYLDGIRDALNLDQLYQAVQSDPQSQGKIKMRDNTASFGFYRFFHAGKSTADTLAISLNVELNRLVNCEKEKSKERSHLEMRDS